MRKPFALSLAVVLAGSLACLAQGENYDSRSFARLSYVSGEVHVQRSGDLGYEAGTVNLVLVEGDKLGIQNGRAEVNFGGLNCLRLDRLSQVEFVNLPQGEAEPFKLHLFSGSLYLRINRLLSDREFEVHTPDASLYVLSEGLFRVDVLENSQSRFSAIEGEAETAGEEKSLTLREGQSLTVANGRFLSGLENAYAAADDFGRWSQSRDGLMAQNVSGSSYLPEELSEYQSELDESGDWRYESDYGYVWVPRVRYYDDWRPYYYGRWVWYPIIGWTWIADEPWGWCVYHYGRWHWGASLGWYWIPTRHWGPAWVHWYWDHQYVGWCALNWWNRPTVVVDNHFYGRYNRSDYSVHNRAMVVVHRGQLQAPRASAVALRGDALNRIGSVALSSRQPAIAPSVARSGRVSTAASRTFLLSRGRNVERTFGRQEALRGTNLRSRGQQGVVNPSGIIQRNTRDRQEIRSRPSKGSVLRGQPSASERSAIREYSLPGRRSGVSGSSVRSRTNAPGASAAPARRIRSYPSDSAAPSGSPSVRSRATVRSSPEAYRSRTTSPPANSGRITTRSSSQREFSRSSGFQSRSQSTGNKSSWSLPERSASSPSSRRTSSYRSAPSSSRSRSSSNPSYSRPTYNRPSYSLSTPRSRSSSGRTVSPNSARSRTQRTLSSPSSRSSASRRSSGTSSRSFSSPSRSSGSASRGRSTSGRSSSSSSKKDSRSSRRR